MIYHCRGCDKWPVSDINKDSNNNHNHNNNNNNNNNKSNKNKNRISNHDRKCEDETRAETKTPPTKRSKRTRNPIRYVLLVLSLTVSNTWTGCLGSNPPFSTKEPSANLKQRFYRRTAPVGCGGKYLEGYSLAGGTKAGRYANMGPVQDMDECSALCCGRDDCELAIMLLYPKTNNRSCFAVFCYEEYNTNRCKPVISSKSKYHPHIFKREMQSTSSEDNHINGTETNSTENKNGRKNKETPDLNAPPIQNVSKENELGINEKRMNRSDISTRRIDQNATVTEIAHKKDSNMAKTTENNTTALSTAPAETPSPAPPRMDPSSSPRPRSKESCSPYVGSACSDYVDTSKLYYYATHNSTALDNRLIRPMEKLRSRLTNGKCRQVALQAICYRFYPQCRDPNNPKAIRICNGDCDRLVSGECAGEFQKSNLVTYLQRIIPGCNTSLTTASSGGDCIELMDQVTPVGSGEGDEDELDVVGEVGEGEVGTSSLNGRSERSGETKSEALKNGLTEQGSTNSSSANLQNMKNSDNTKKSDATNNSDTTVNSNTTKSSDIVPNDQMSENPVHVSPKPESSRKTRSHNSAATTVTPYVTAAHPITLKHTSVATTTNTTITTTTLATRPPTKRPETTHAPNKQKIKIKENAPEIVNITGSNDNVPSLDIKEKYDQTPNEKNEVNHTTSANTPTKILHPAEKEEEENLEVSAGENKELTLPLNHVHLISTTNPKEGDFAYKWVLLAHPKTARPELMGETSKILDMTNLDVPGLYAVKVEVKRNNGHKTGVSFVNVTVKPLLNKPPTAEITTDSRNIKLPTNRATLDGSKSTDDVGIVSYKWELVGGPSTEKSIFDSPSDSRILRLKDLIVGKYRIRLTVIDADSVSDSKEITITVHEDDNRPPIAKAGDDVILRLPNDTLTLNGNQSHDDVGILSYRWTKTPDSPACEMLGERTSQLQLSHLQQGVYIFVLKVTDASGKSNEDRVMVTVLPPTKPVKPSSPITSPPKPAAPVAVAGENKELVYPDDSTAFDASKSTSESGIASYHWEQLSGPTPAKLTGTNTKRVHVLGLSPGTYVIKLTVTDSRGEASTDTVQVHVKGATKEDLLSGVTATGGKKKGGKVAGGNEGVVAVAGVDQTVYLPIRSVVLDGSGSHSSDVIEQFMWVRAGSSPAAGVVINGSDHKSILHMTDLVKGRYQFQLTVTDRKGNKNTDTVTVVVKEDKRSLGLVEMSLHVDVDRFLEKEKNELILKLSQILSVGKDAVIVEEITRSTYVTGTMLLFYVNNITTNEPIDGQHVADVVKKKIGLGGKIAEYKLQTIEPYICRNNCSEHGYCDTTTKQCVCDPFWVANVFKAKFGAKMSNCEWSILYLSVVIFSIFLFFIFVAWVVCFCCARKRRGRRRTRYSSLRKTGEKESREEILLIPKGMKEKFSVNSLTFSDSDEDSCDETTVFDKKIISNGHIRMNGSVKGPVKYRERDHGMQ